MKAIVYEEFGPPEVLEFMNMTMLKPLWEEIWMGIFGLFLAFGLKKRQKYAWTMGIFWGL